MRILRKGQTSHVLLKVALIDIFFTRIAVHTPPKFSADFSPNRMFYILRPVSLLKLSSLNSPLSRKFSHHLLFKACFHVNCEARVKLMPVLINKSEMI